MNPLVSEEHPAEGVGEFPMFRRVSGDPRWHKYRDCPRFQMPAGPAEEESFGTTKLRIEADGGMINPHTFHRLGTMCPDCFDRWMKAMFPR